MSTAALLIPRAIHFFVFFYIKHVQLLYFVFRYIISHDKLFGLGVRHDASTDWKLPHNMEVTE
jgi:hypothetical protein